MTVNSLRCISLRGTSLRRTVLLFSLSFALCGQNGEPSGAARINGRSGEAKTITLQGKRYVDLDAIVALLGASQQTQGNSTTISLRTNAATDEDQGQQRLSREFLSSGIELVSVIREWRQAIIHAVVNSYGFLDQITGPYERNADSKLAAVEAAASSDGDRAALDLLKSETRLMRKFSTYYLDRWRKSLGVFPDEIENDALGKQVLDCARGMASMAASHQFQDVPACHGNE